METNSITYNMNQSITAAFPLQICTSHLALPQQLIASPQAVLPITLIQVCSRSYPISKARLPTDL